MACLRGVSRRRRSTRYSVRLACRPFPSFRLSALPPYRRSRAGNGTRTRDPNLGKVVLYQLSYSRRFTMLRTRRCFYCNGLSQNGGEGNRTPDLVNAIHALSQLSYAPVILDADKKSGWAHGKLAEPPEGVKRRALPRATIKFGAVYASRGAPTGQTQQQHARDRR